MHGVNIKLESDVISPDDIYTVYLVPALFMP